MKTYCDSCNVMECNLRGKVKFCDGCEKYFSLDSCFGIGNKCKAWHDLRCVGGYVKDDDKIGGIK